MWRLAPPKILHCYWGGSLLPYLRFMTIKSFMNLNPDWKVILWHPKVVFESVTWTSGELDYKVKCRNFLPELMELPIIKEEVDFEVLGFRKNTAEVHKCDYIRINSLSLYGGVWTDMDVIYFKPIIELEVNKEKNRNVETFVCICGYGHSTGFMMAAENSRFFDGVADVMTKELNPLHYQCLGPSLMNKYFPKVEMIKNCINLSMDVVYTYDANHITELIGNGKSRFTENSIGCHWYGGHQVWGKYLNETNGGLIKKENIISQCYA